MDLDLIKSKVEERLKTIYYVEDFHVEVKLKTLCNKTYPAITIYWKINKDKQNNNPYPNLFAPLGDVAEEYNASFTYRNMEEMQKMKTTFLTDTDQDKINKLADLLLLHKNTCVLTGAGMSTESGIPDFRSAKTGMFNTLKQEYLCYTVMKDEPVLFWKNFEIFAKVGLQDIKPNKGHYALAELEKMGLIGHIITQNVDGLHQAAGNTKVVEAHGHFKEAYCMNSKCGHVFPYQLIADAMADGSYRPKCPDCGYPLRPSVVLYGDQLPQVYHQFYNNDLYKYDFLLVLGTSLEVSTAQNVVREFEGYCNYAIINKSSTNKDYKAKVLIRAGIGDTLEKLVEVIKGKQNG